jgi:predicted nucleic acid-binding Zn ribbon protein
MRRSSRKSLAAPEALDHILDRAGENRFARVKPPIAASVWRDAVGARIAEHAQPIAVTYGVVLLRTATSVWAHELSFLADEICTRLRARGVEARQLRFQVGAIAPIERPAERRVARTVPRPFSLPPELADVMAGVEDRELAATIAGAAASNLAWQSKAQRATAATPVNEGLRGARAPQSAEREIAPRAQSRPAVHAGAPGTPEGARGRRR